jgi:hypothetical protein
MADFSFPGKECKDDIEEHGSSRSLLPTVRQPQFINGICLLPSQIAPLASELPALRHSNHMDQLATQATRAHLHLHQMAQNLYGHGRSPPHETVPTMGVVYTMPVDFTVCHHCGQTVVACAQLPANTALAHETATTMGVEFPIPVEFTCAQTGQTVVAYAQLPANTALPTDMLATVSARPRSQSSSDQASTQSGPSTFVQTMLQGPAQQETRFEDLSESAVLGESAPAASAAEDDFSFSDYIDYERRQLGYAGLGAFGNVGEPSQPVGMDGASASNNPQNDGDLYTLFGIPPGTFGQVDNGVD